mmetsp:Transcript_64496/g.126655  ORF Transcript_64496/g.126655 Transcript_64496/m.126655 type:complete len:288 (+) Transcript_64496:232-1095(+)
MRVSQYMKRHAPSASDPPLPSTTPFTSPYHVAFKAAAISGAALPLDSSRKAGCVEEPEPAEAALMSFPSTSTKSACGTGLKEGHTTRLLASAMVPKSTLTCTNDPLGARLTSRPPLSPVLGASAGSGTQHTAATGEPISSTAKPHRPDRLQRRTVPSLPPDASKSDSVGCGAMGEQQPRATPSLTPPPPFPPPSTKAGAWQDRRCTVALESRTTSTNSEDAVTTAIFVNEPSTATAQTLERSGLGTHSDATSNALDKARDASPPTPATAQTFTNPSSPLDTTPMRPL